MQIKFLKFQKEQHLKTHESQTHQALERKENDWDVRKDTTREKPQNLNYKWEESKELGDACDWSQEVKVI